MKIRVISFFALMLCMSVVFFPLNAYATCDKTPPAILAWLVGADIRDRTVRENQNAPARHASGQESDALHIEASGGQNGVEAVYINENRVNYNAVNNINLPLRSYAGTGRFISVYAVDYAGNKSNTIVIDNPYYVPPATMPPPPPPTPSPEPTPVPTLTPVVASVPVETAKPVATAPPSQSNTSNPFTPAGTGTTVDNATSGDGKEFFTISSTDGNVFHLIIDRQRNAENVYLLNAVTEDDLMALATKSNKSGSVSAIPTPEPAPASTTAPAPAPEPAQTPEPQAVPPVAKTNNTGQYIMLLLVVLGAGGAGYYFKIVKPRQQSPDDSDFDEDDEDGGGHEDDTDLEMEDDPEDGDED